MDVTKKKYNLPWPDEIDFLGRGFGLGPAHEPDEAVFNYQRAYGSGEMLALLLGNGDSRSIEAAIHINDKVLARVCLEDVRDAAFQGWSGERTFRLRSTNVDLRIHYDPIAAIHTEG